MPSIGEDPVPEPFSWGDQYMEETPNTIEAFIAILEIDLLREFETLMGTPLLSNLFLTACILLAWDISAKIKTSQGIQDALDIICCGK